MLTITDVGNAVLQLLEENGWLKSTGLFVSETGVINSIYYGIWLDQKTSWLSIQIYICSDGKVVIHNVDGNNLEIYLSDPNLISHLKSIIIQNFELDENNCFLQTR